MSEKPILLFLHGVGDGDPKDEWKTALEQSLSRAGYPSLDGVRVIAPVYARALRGTDEPGKLPDTTIKNPGRDAANLNRREFERRLAGIEHRIGRHDEEHILNEAIGGAGSPVVDAAAKVAVSTKAFEQAANYLRDEQIRAQVLTRVLSKLPESGKIVIVAHSLGSVIAADLLLRLPVDIDVEAMVTIGSPLANESFDLDGLRVGLSDPPANLGWWVNFRNAWDPVATRRGLSSVFPWLLDHKINTGYDVNPKRWHAARTYLGHITVADTLGHAIFGSPWQPIPLTDTSADMPRDEAERQALLGLRYGHHIKNELSAETRRRYLAALRAVQAQTVSDLRARNKHLHRPIPLQIARLDFDYTNAASPLPEPSVASWETTKDEAVVLMTALAATNIVAPFDISIPKDIEQRAMEELSLELGLKRQFGTDVLESGKRAQVVLRENQNLQWVKVGALVVGAAALVVGTGGLALAATPGLVGAAVVTSALASFGPGGMIGGLITAGALVGGGGLLAGSGGGTIAAGVSGAETSSDEFEGFVALQLAAVLLRQTQKIEINSEVWDFLTDVETRVNRQHERLDEISDPKSRSVKELAKKRVIVQRALKYLGDRGLEPNESSEFDAETSQPERRGARFTSPFKRSK